MAGGSGGSGGQHNEQIGKFAEQAVGGGALGGLVGALAGGIGGGLLSGFGDDKKTSTVCPSPSFSSRGQISLRMSSSQIGEFQCLVLC